MVDQGRGSRSKILIVDDETGPREGMRRLLEAWGHEAVTASSAEQAFAVIERESPSAVLTDLVMPETDGIEFVRRLQSEHPLPVIVLSGQGTIEQAVEAIKVGAQDFLEKPVEPAKLKILLERLAATRALVMENRQLRAQLRDRGAFGRLRGVSEKMKSVYRQIEQVAESSLSVLIVGESGTGKELVAQTVHELSPRKRNEFVALNCAAIPATLLESEVFGHERGAFTGAIQRKAGCFEMAHRGTLFLDEISEMDELLQAKLLRVLEERRFRRIGGKDLIETDVRVVVATNRDPRKAIAERKLREDLYYRLNVFSIYLPPLRERPEDIPHLAMHFAAEYAARSGSPVPVIEHSAMTRLLEHSWPGNARELKNAIERGVLLSEGAPITGKHLPSDVPTARHATVEPRQAEAGMTSGGTGEMMTLRVGSSIQEAEYEMIRRTLAHTLGNKTKAAKLLKISLKTIHTKVKQIGA